MAENVKLKDLYAVEQTYDGIDTVKIPKADGSGDATFVVPPTSMYMLKESSYSGTEESSAYAYSGVESDITTFGNNVQKELYPNALPIPTVHNYTFGENNIYCHPLESMTITELMNRMLRVFSDDNVTVTPNTYSVTPGWFHIQYTKTGEGWNIQVNITEFEEVADPSTITFPAYLPWTINDANYFYSYIAEATQQVKAVTVTENGTQTINPDAGKSGLAAVKLTVNVSTAPVGAYYLLKDPLGAMPAYEGGFVRYDNGSGVGGSDFKPFLAVVGNLNANSSLGYVNTSAFSYRAKEEEGFTSLIFIWYAAAAETMSAMVLQQFTGAWPFGDVALAKGWNITTFSESDGNVSANTVATTIDGVNEQLSSYGGIPENNFDDWAAIDSYTLSFFKKFGLFSLQQEKSVAVSSNGNIEILPDEGYDGMSKVSVSVNVEAGSVGTLTRSIVKSTVGKQKSISIPKSVDSFHVILANLGAIVVKASNGFQTGVSLNDDAEFDVVNGQPIPDYVVNGVTWYTFSAKETNDGLSYTYTITPTLTVGSSVTLYGTPMTVTESDYGCSFIVEYFV